MRKTSAWILIQALALYGLLPVPSLRADSPAFVEGQYLRASQQGQNAAGVEEIRRQLVGEPARAGSEEAGTYAHLLAIAVPHSPQDNSWKQHPNFLSLVKIFGSAEQAERAVRASLKRQDPEGKNGLVPYQIVQGLLHPKSLEGFLKNAHPADTSGDWTALWHDRSDGAVGFILEEFSKISPDVVDLGGGSALQTNFRVQPLHPSLRGLTVLGLTNNSDNGGRTQRIYDALLPVFGPTERSGDATAPIKGWFSAPVQEEIMEPDHQGRWMNPTYWASRKTEDPASFRSRVVTLLSEFSGDPKQLKAFERNEPMPFVQLAVELLNIATLTDEIFIRSGALPTDLPSVRHMIRNALFAAVGAYDTNRKELNQERYWLGIYLAARVFGPLIFVNSVDAQELHATWTDAAGQLLGDSTQAFATPSVSGSPKMETITARGQVAISLRPDARTEGGVVRYGDFGVIEPDAAAAGRVVPKPPRRDPLLERLLLHAKPGALVRFGPSSFVVSLSSIILPDYSRVIAEERPDLAGTMVLNLTRNGETLGWSLKDYITFWEKVTGHLFEKTVKYLLINTLWPAPQAFGEAQDLAAAVGNGTTNYAKALKEFNLGAPTYQASLNKLRSAGLPDPETQLVLALAFSDNGESLTTYKDRGGVPVPSRAELEALAARGITVILDQFATTRGEKYLPGQGRTTVYGAYHDKYRLARAYAWIREEQLRRIREKQPPAQGGIYDFSVFPLESFDPLDETALAAPVDVTLSDMDETAAQDRNASISDRTAELIGKYVKLGGEWQWLSTRDKANIEQRGRVEEIKKGLDATAKNRLGIHARSGIGHPKLQALVADRQKLLDPQRLLEAAHQATGLKPAGPYSGEASGNPNHMVYEFGDLAVYIPKPNSPPGTMATYAYRPALDAGRMTKPEADLARRDLRPKLLETGLFPEGVSLGYGGTTSLNVEVAGKRDLLQEGYLNEPAYAGKRIGVLDDEALPGFSGYPLFTLQHPNLVQIAVDPEKVDPALPSHVIRSLRKMDEAVNRYLEIEIAKREAMQRLGEDWDGVRARIEKRLPGQSAVQALFALAASAGVEEAQSAVASRLNIPAVSLERVGQPVKVQGRELFLFREPAGQLSAAVFEDGRWRIPIARDLFNNEAGLPNLQLLDLRRALLSSLLFPLDSPARRQVDWTSRIPVRLMVQVRRTDLPNKREYARQIGEIPHSYLTYTLLDPESKTEIASLMMGFSPPGRPDSNDVILADVTMPERFGHTGLDLQLLTWIVSETLAPAITTIRHRHWNEPQDKQLGGRVIVFGAGRFINTGREPFQWPQDVDDFDLIDEKYSPWRFDVNPSLSRKRDAPFSADSLPDGETRYSNVSFLLTRPPLDNIEERLVAAGLEEVPQFTASELEGWAQRLSPDDALYGWITRLPDAERSSLLDTLARSYGTFGQFMRQVADRVVQSRADTQVHRKLDKSAVTDVEREIQSGFNTLAGQFDSMSGIGEEGQTTVPNPRYLLLSDPIDGTGNYILSRDHPMANRYASVMSILYKTGDGAWHPVLTLSVLPEYPHGGNPALWLAAGVGIDGVSVNGHLVRAAGGRLLQESVASFNVLAAEGKERYNRATAPYNQAYQKALKSAGAKETRQEPDGTSLFLLPLSIEDPAVPALSLTGPAWDIFSVVHIALALGGRVYRMDQKTPFDLSAASFDDPQSRKNPPLLLAASARAAEDLLQHYVPPSEEEAPTVTYNPTPVTQTRTGTPIATISRLQAELTTRVTGYTPGKQTGKLAFVVTPDGVSKFAVASVVFGAGNIAADVIAKDEKQQKLIEQHLASLGFDMTQVIVYSAAGEPWNGDIARAMSGLAQGRTDAGYAVQTVTRDTGLGNIARFLGIAAAESDMQEMELIAADSNDVWL